MSTYRVTFERTDSDHAVEPMVFEDVENPDELAALMYERGRQYLTSSDVYEQADVDEMTVVVDLDDMTGGFYMPARLFAIEEMPPQRGTGEGR